MEAIIKREIIVSKSACRLLGVMMFVILISLGAFVRIPLPFTPVPVTLQTFFVLLSGAFLGNRFGVITQISYILMGVSGLPIFTGAGSGVLYLLGPTGGYLLGFVFCSLLVGSFIKYAKDNKLQVFGVMMLADIFILLTGIVWLKLLFGYTWQKLFFIGFLPFIPGDVCKAALASVLFLKLKPRLKEVF